MADAKPPAAAAKRRRSTPTSAEVAAVAGVSRTTVSFVLNDVRNMNISEVTRRKVLEAARTLGYEPNAAARSLAGGSSRTVAMLIPRSDHLHVDAFLPRLLSAVNDRCHAHGYKVLLEAADDQGKMPGAFMNLARSKRVDGLVIANMRVAERPFVEQLVRERFPVVVPGNGIEPFHSRGGSSGDDAKLARNITQHLIDLGHRRIAHVGFAAEEFEVVALRRTGYQQALLAAGLQADPALVSYADMSAHSAYLAVKAMLARKVAFTALFAGNDTIAFGALHALHEAGLTVPRDVALVGYDDIPLAGFARPALTTLQTDPLAIGTEAVDHLHGQMTGIPYKRRETAYAVRFIVRESCGAAAAAAAVAAAPARLAKGTAAAVAPAAAKAVKPAAPVASRRRAKPAAR